MRTTRSHNKMRSGISLVEMMIAVILFGVISIVGFKYSKNYYDTDLTAKKARVAALIEQATQLSGAYDIYVAQMGTAPTAINDLNASNVKILTSIPSTITEIGTTGWTLDIATDYTGSGSNDIAFTFAITDPGGADISDEEYCAVFNNTIDNSLSLEVNDGDDFDTTANQYTALGNAFCYGSDASKEIILLKEAN